MRSLGIAGAVQTHRTGEPPEAALDQMKSGVASAAPRGLFADDQDCIALHQDANGGRFDAREIDGEFDALVGLEHVERRRALASQRLGPEGPSQLEEDLPDLVREVANFRRNHDGVHSGAHPR